MTDWYYAQLFTWYADQTNFVKTIRPTYAKLLAFPTRYFVPIRLRNNAKARLEKFEVEITDDDSSPSETEDLKKLMETGWHHVSTGCSGIEEWISCV
jgi:hypothetical protein